jgi:hypothetical protein
MAGRSWMADSRRNHLISVWKTNPRTHCIEQPVLQSESMAWDDADLVGACDLPGLQYILLQKITSCRGSHRDSSCRRVLCCYHTSLGHGRPECLFRCLHIVPGQHDVGQLAVIIGLTGASSTFVGVEAGAHMAEEVRDAASIIPRAMMWTLLGNGLLGWIMAITFCYCVGDTLFILTTPLGTPFIQVFLNTTGSVRGATGLTVLMLIIAIFACVAVMATNSRQLFAFARENGVPFSKIFSKASLLPLA